MTRRRSILTTNRSSRRWHTTVSYTHLDVYKRQLLFKTPDGEVILDGSHVTSAKAGNTTDKLTGNNNYVVQLTFDEEGKEKFAEATQANIGNRIAIVYDGNTVSAPTVKSAITNGECVIENMESYEAAESLASTIRIGSLQLELKEILSLIHI